MIECPLFMIVLAILLNVVIVVTYAVLFLFCLFSEGIQAFVGIFLWMITCALHFIYMVFNKLRLLFNV